MELSQAIVERLLKLMKEKEFSQYDFYVKGGIPKSTVSQILNGNRKDMAVSTVYQMVATLGVSMSEFFDDEIFSKVTD